MTPLDQAPGIIGTLVALGAVVGAWKGLVVLRVRNSNGRRRNGTGAEAKLIEERHEQVMGAFGALAIAITDLSHAVTELRIEVAKRD